MAGFFDSLFSGGKYERELKDLQKKAKQEPKNFHLQVKIADLLEKMGKRREALVAYRNVSEKYSHNGFLVQAIAVNKVILRLDPSQTQIHDQLAELYAKREMAQEERGEREALPGSAKEVPQKEMPAVPLFSDLRKEELSRVIEKIRARQFARGTAICREGDSGDSIFIISHGKVGIFRHPTGGEKVFITELNEGEFFGEFGFFSNSRRQATVETVVDTEVLEITKQDLEEIIRDFPSVSEVLLKFYRERILDSLLATSSLFRSFSNQERKQILGKFTVEGFPVGATVLEEGAPGDSLYIIKKGQVEVYTIDVQGAPLTLAQLKEGDFFGEISLLKGQPRTASVRVLQEVELLRLGKNDFDQINARHPEVKQILEDSLLLRLENKMKALGVFRDSPAKEGFV